MDPIEHLAQLLNELPGIGPRQAKRLAYALILKPAYYAQTLSSLIHQVREEVKNCTSCYRFVSQKNLMNGLCSICRDTNRDNHLLMVVSRDVDLQSMERSGFYKGTYFVLGGSVPVLEKSPESFIRLREFKDKLTKSENVDEIILAYNQIPEGEHTARIIEETIKDIDTDVKISHLGRGLSTGTELEYSDNETLRNALRNRS